MDAEGTRLQEHCLWEAADLGSPGERGPIGAFSQATHDSYELPDSVRETAPACSLAVRSECSRAHPPKSTFRRGMGRSADSCELGYVSLELSWEPQVPITAPFVHIARLA